MRQIRSIWDGTVCPTNLSITLTSLLTKEDKDLSDLRKAVVEKMPKWVYKYKSLIVLQSGTLLPSGIHANYQVREIKANKINKAFYNNNTGEK